MNVTLEMTGAEAEALLEELPRLENPDLGESFVAKLRKATLLVRIAQATREAYVTDDYFSEAVKNAGYKTRWEWPGKDEPNPDILLAYRHKLAADRRLLDLLEEGRRCAP